ncbi:MAG TPA: hypothetical protein DEP84_33820, partial [Chloroflexi bacterium]|nr:hypothetical protein [Chloroflexota bacterium]
MGAAIITVLLGGWSVARYARLLAWSALAGWIVAGTLALTCSRGRPAGAGDWRRFFFLAGMPLSRPVRCLNGSFGGNDSAARRSRRIV